MTSFKVILFLLVTNLSMSGRLAEAQVQVKERTDIVVDDALFKEAAGELRCPTCTGLSVLDSDAPFSVQIKNQVREQLAKGASVAEVKDFFEERYGPWILRSPPKRGFFVLAWILPVAALVIGLLAIALFVYRREPQSTNDVTRASEVIAAEFLQRVSDARKQKRGNV